MSSPATTVQHPSHRAPSHQWLDAAYSHAPEHHTLNVNGAAIAYRSWGTEHGQDLLLIHGGAAHSGWWDHIAPLFATRGRVVALDLGGHGDSGHRPSYDMDQWSQEVLAVRRDTGLDQRGTLIGHSLGGLITLHLREDARNSVGRAIIIDSPIGGPEANKLPEARAFTSKRRVHPDQHTAMARFRAVPEQPAIDQIVQHIAAQSVRKVAGGWGWKFDEQLFGGPTRMKTTVPASTGRLAYFRSEYGLASPTVRTPIEAAGGSFIELPTAGHAPMLDQPVALVTAIRTVLSSWDAADRCLPQKSPVPATRG